jgi:hypothetical protein
MGEALAARLDAAWAEWLRALDLVDPSLRADRHVCGHWTVKDLVGHMALWDAEVLTDIQRWELGLPWFSNDWQQMNDHDHAAKRDRPYDLLRVEMYLVHETTRAALLRLPDEIPPELAERIGVDTWDHYPEHTGQVRAAFAS